MYIKRKWQLSLTSIFWRLQQKAEQLRINHSGLARKKKASQRLRKPNQVRLHSKTNAALTTKKIGQLLSTLESTHWLQDSDFSQGHEKQDHQESVVGKGGSQDLEAAW